MKETRKTATSLKNRYSYRKNCKNLFLRSYCFRDRTHLRTLIDHPGFRVVMDLNGRRDGDTRMHDSMMEVSMKMVFVEMGNLVVHFVDKRNSSLGVIQLEGANE